MLGFSNNLRYFLCCAAIDMRNGFDGLSGIVKNHLKKDPISGDVFIFINKMSISNYSVQPFRSKEYNGFRNKVYNVFKDKFL